MSVSHEPAGAAGALTAAPRSFLDALDEVSEAVEAGSGLPSVARAAGRALDASVIVLDSRSSVLAVACASPEDERAVMALEGDARSVDLTVAEVAVGELRYRPRAAEPAPSLLRLVANLIGLEVDRAKAPERASEAAVADFVNDLLSRRIPDGETVAARAPSSAATSRREPACSSPAPGRSTLRRATGGRACSRSPSAARARLSARRSPRWSRPAGSRATAGPRRARAVPRAAASW